MIARLTLGRVVRPCKRLARRIPAISAMLLLVALSPSTRAAPMEQVTWTSDSEAQTGTIVADAMGDQENPAIAYGETNERYLTVWEDWRNVPYRGTDPDIYARWLTVDGTSYGDEFAIARAVGRQSRPAVAYAGDWAMVPPGGGGETAVDAFLVIWEDSVEDPAKKRNLSGAWVLVDGSRTVGEPFVVTDANENQRGPAVGCLPSWASKGDEAGPSCLVAWVDERSDPTAPDIYGRIVTEAGPQGQPGGFAIMDASGDQRSPVVAAGDQEFLVVWSDHVDEGASVLGQRLSRDGWLLDNEGSWEDETSPSVAFQISDGPYDRYPAAAHRPDPTDGAYLVGWTRGDAPGDVFAQRVGNGGDLLGGNALISERRRTKRVQAIAYDSITDNFLIVWIDSFFFDLSNVFLRQVSADGVPVSIDRPVCGAAGNQWEAALDCSGHSGCVVTWQDDASQLTRWDVSATRYEPVPNQTYGWTLSDFTVNGNRPPVHLQPAADIEVAFDYEVWTLPSNTCDSSHIVVAVEGFEGDSSICVSRGRAKTWPEKDSGTISGSLSPITTPGTHHVAVAATCQPDCPSARTAFTSIPHVRVGTITVGQFAEVSPQQGRPGTLLTIRGYAEPLNASGDGEVYAIANWAKGEPLGSAPVDSTGTFVIQAEIPWRASPGVYHMWVDRFVHRPDWFVSQLELRTIAEDLPITVEAIPEEIISGRLLTSRDQPIEGGTVRLLAAASDGHLDTWDDAEISSSETRLDGGYSMLAMPGEWMLSAEASGYKPHFEPILVRTGDTLRRTIHLAEYDPGVPPAVDRVVAKIDGLSAVEEIGRFVSLPDGGLPVTNTFKALLQQDAAAAADRVEFVLAGTSISDTDGSDGWTASFDMSALDPGENPLAVRAYSGRDAGPATEVAVQVLQAPLWFGKPWAYDSVAGFSDLAWVYHLQAKVPEGPKLLWQRDYRPPVIVPFKNLYHTELMLKAKVDLTGEWSFSSRGEVDAAVLGRSVLDQPIPLRVSQPAGEIFPPRYDVGPARYDFHAESVPVHEAALLRLYDLIDIGVSVDFGFDATVSAQGSLRRDGSVEDMVFAPELAPSLEVSLWPDAVLGSTHVMLFSTADMTYTLPVRYESEHDPQMYLGDGDLSLYVMALVAAQTRYPAWPGWVGNGWSSGPQVLADWHPHRESLDSDLERESAAGYAAKETVADGSLSAPSVAADDSGHVLAVWIADQDPSQDGFEPSLTWSQWRGSRWSEPALLSDDAGWASDPAVSFIDSNRALAVWTAVSEPPEPDPPIGESDQLAGLDHVLAQQEIYASLWNGETETWSVPRRLTDDQVPDGMASVAGTSAGADAVVAWVRDGDGKLATREDWDIWHSFWSSDDGTWSAPVPLADDPDAAEMSPAAAMGSDGRVTVAWVRDEDTKISTNVDRRLALRQWRPDIGWGSETRPEGFPTGVLGPAITSDESGPLLAFSVLGELPSGSPAGLGTEAELWTALEFGDRFEAYRIEPAGEPISLADKPVIDVSDEGLATIVYRSLAAPDPTNLAGELYMITADVWNAPMDSLDAAPLGWHPPWSEPTQLTHNIEVDWQQSLALDGDNRAHVLAVEVGRQGLEAADTPRRLERGEAPAVASQTIQDAGSSSLYALSISPLPDLTVTSADIALSDPMALPGDGIDVQVTLRNAGLGAVRATEAYTVQVYAGDPDDPANLLGERTISQVLLHNDEVEFALPWEFSCSESRITVAVDPANKVLEADENNNIAESPLSRPDPVQILHAAADASIPSVFVEWQEASDPRLKRYHVYRTAEASGDLHFVAITRDTSFTDAGVQAGHTYEYAVTAVNACDMESIGSERLEVALEPAPPSPTPSPIATGVGSPTATPSDTPGTPATPGPPSPTVTPGESPTIYLPFAQQSRR